MAPDPSDRRMNSRGSDKVPEIEPLAAGRQRLTRAAAEIYRMRRERDRLMPAGLMGEPAWDMLLALYSEEPGKLPPSSLCYASGVPSSTALRWIEVLSQQGLVERTEHKRDPHLVLLSLTGKGRTIVERCLKAMVLCAAR